jgi:hypothetical protein
LPNAEDAFLKHFKNDSKPIINHLNYNWYFIPAYLGDGGVEIEKYDKIRHLYYGSS